MDSAKNFVYAMRKPRPVQPLRVAWFKIPLGIVTNSTRHSYQFHSLGLKNPGSSKFFVVARSATPST